MRAVAGGQDELLPRCSVQPQPVQLQGSPSVLCLAAATRGAGGPLARTGCACRCVCPRDSPRGHARSPSHSSPIFQQGGAPAPPPPQHWGAAPSLGEGTAKGLTALRKGSFPH